MAMLTVTRVATLEWPETQAVSLFGCDKYLGGDYDVEAEKLDRKRGHGEAAFFSTANGRFAEAECYKPIVRYVGR